MPDDQYPQRVGKVHKSRKFLEFRCEPERMNVQFFLYDLAWFVLLPVTWLTCSTTQILMKYEWLSSTSVYRNTLKYHGTSNWYIHSILANSICLEKFGSGFIQQTFLVMIKPLSGRAILENCFTLFAMLKIEFVFYGEQFPSSDPHLFRSLVYLVCYPVVFYHFLHQSLSIIPLLYC